jgi:aarF domain-containing kinase
MPHLRRHHRCFTSVAGAAVAAAGRRRRPAYAAAARGLAGAAIVGAGAGTLLVATDEGSARSLRFWSAAFPVYLRYEWVQQRNLRGFLSDGQAMAQYEALHERWSPFVRDLVYEMRGFYLKNAQLMSTRDDFVPPQYLRWCKETQDNCPTEAGFDAAAVAERELGRPLSEVFERWVRGVAAEPCLPPSPPGLLGSCH